MKLSTKTVDMLKNLSPICDAVTFKAGNVIKATKGGGSVVVNYTIEEELPTDFTLGAVSQFIGAADNRVMRGGDIEFNGSESCTITNGCYKTVYKFSSPMMAKEVTLTVDENTPESDILLMCELSKEQFTTLLSQGKFFNHNCVRFSVADNNLSVSTFESAGSKLSKGGGKFGNGNVFTIDVGYDESPDIQIDIVFDYFQCLIEGAYKFVMRKAKMSNHTNGQVIEGCVTKAFCVDYPAKYAIASTINT